MTSEQHSSDTSGLRTSDGAEITLTSQAQKGLDRLAAVVKDHKLTPCVLFIENPARDHALVVAAFRAVDEKINVQVMEDDSTAIEYLEGNGKFAERSRYPMPTTIILDLTTSRISGLHVLEHIRSRPYLESTVVIALKETVSDRASKKERCPGVTACLPRPVSQTHFVGMLHNLRSSGLI